MRAVQINRYGGYEVLEINENAPRPSVGKGQVLVEVYAVSINPFDWKVRAGYMKEFMPLKFPVTLGGDFAGIVREVGNEVSGLVRGDEVYGSASLFSGGSGSFAEFAEVRIGNAALKPKMTSFIEAAALPLVGSSAVQALQEHIKLQWGQKILIHGGAGGIGHIAIQLAKALGAYVATTVSLDHRDFVKQLGADEIVDYKLEKFEEKLKDFDAVFDTVGGETTHNSFPVLKKGGIMVSMVGQPSTELAKKYGVTVIGQGTNVNTKQLDSLREFVDKEKIRVNIGKVFPLDEVREAFKYQEEDHPRGKVVIKIKQ